MKKAVIALCVLTAIVLLFPFRLQMKDGGTVHYDAVLYDIYDMHRIKPTDPPDTDGTYQTEYIDGIIVEVFCIEIWNDTSIQYR
jgi:hypothetical protein